MIRKNLCRSPPEFSPCPLFCSLFKRLLPRLQSTDPRSLPAVYFYFLISSAFLREVPKKKKVFITHLSRVRYSSDAELGGAEDLVDSDVL